MKVLIANTLYPPYASGGAEVSVQELAGGLAERGAEVDVVTTAPLPASEMHGGVRVTYLADLNRFWPFDGARRPSPQRKVWHAVDVYNRRSQRAMAELIATRRPDVVHTNNLQGLSVSVWWAAHRAGVPILHTARDYYLTCARATRWRDNECCRRTCAACLPFFAARRLASSLVRGVAGVSRSILDLHTALGFFPNADIARVIRTAWPPTPANPPREPTGATPVFGFLGRLEPYKGIELLLHAFSEPRANEARLVVAGAGRDDYLAKLRQIGSKNSRHIEFAGVLPAAQLLRKVDALVVPSLWHEPLSRSTLEAQAQGIPVVASRRGGLVEVIEDGVDGLLFDPDTPATLSSAIDRLAGDPVLRRDLGKRAWQRSQQRGPDELVAAYVSFYEDIIES